MGLLENVGGGVARFLLHVLEALEIFILTLGRFVGLPRLASDQRFL